MRKCIGCALSLLRCPFPTLLSGGARGQDVSHLHRRGCFPRALRGQDPPRRRCARRERLTPIPAFIARGERKRFGVIPPQEINLGLVERSMHTGRVGTGDERGVVCTANLFTEILHVSTANVRIAFFRDGGIVEKREALTPDC